MKKVLISLALSILCLVVTIGSFLANDVTAYKDWAMQNSPRVMEKFERRFGGFGRELPPPPPAPRVAPGEDRRQPPEGAPKEGRHHEMKAPHGEQKD